MFCVCWVILIKYGLFIGLRTKSYNGLVYRVVYVWDETLDTPIFFMLVTYIFQGNDAWMWFKLVCHGELCQVRPLVAIITFPDLKKSLFEFQCLVRQVENISRAYPLLRIGHIISWMLYHLLKQWTTVTTVTAKTGDDDEVVHPQGHAFLHWLYNAIFTGPRCALCQNPHHSSCLLCRRWQCALALSGHVSLH